MRSKYGDIPPETVKLNSMDIVNQIFKLLPLKENNDNDLDFHFSTLLFRLNGMAQLFPEEPRWITIMALLESARTEDNFKLYRKAILDCCSLVRSIRGDIYA